MTLHLPLSQTYMKYLAAFVVTAALALSAMPAAAVFADPEVDAQVNAQVDVKGGNKVDKNVAANEDTGAGADAAPADKAQAASTVEPDPDSLPVLKRLKKDLPKSAYDYLGLAEGMHVWLLSGPGMMQMIYVPENGTGAIVGGTLVNNDGELLSTQLQKNFVTRYPKRSTEIVNLVHNTKENGAQENADGSTGDNKPDAVSAQELLWRKFITASPVVYQGEAGSPEIITVLDPAQQDTQTVWKKLGPLAKSGKITWRIMPLALTTPDSIMHISAILNHENPASAWEDLMEDRLNDIPQNFEPKAAESLKRTIELATELSLRKTPFFIYRAGGTDGNPAPVQVISGMPKDWDALLQRGKE